jgi:predicted Zn finger-like uncharacterized protein
VKFLCDKCKTRYSIGDDRVRGKILKIRCKNCANVITVREGMDIDVREPRRNPTMAIQKVDINEVANNPMPQGALGAAFAQQMTKPPPALEEEWYVSMDGNQEGPFNLGDAQRWVGAKPFEAELHCWSEGFDDWLPVDKVSHFRNLRRQIPARAPKPVTAPPPIPKVPQPLFAATMASIEKTVGPEPAKVTIPAKLPAISNVPTLRGSGAVSTPMTTKANGTGVGHAFAPSASASAFPAAAPSFRDDPAESNTMVGAPMFDVGEDANEGPTHRDRNAHPLMDDAADGEDNLDIGEVSRVVKISDIGRMTPGQKTSTPALRAGGGGTASNPALRGTASSPALRGTASNPALRGTASNPAIRNNTAGLQKLTPEQLGMNVDLQPGAPAPDESMLAQSFAQRHRRGMFILLGVSAVMVAGVVVAVMMVTGGGESDLPVGLGGTRVIDTSRPEDIVRKQLPPTPNQQTATNPTRPKYRPSGQQQVATPVQPDLPATGPGSRLDAGEVEAMAAKYGEGTKRCYMRAQKGALGFEIADTKKIDVTLTVGKDGVVSSVQLSKHANNEFGQCLISRIKGWRFRESAGGTFRIALAFSAS